MNSECAITQHLYEVKGKTLTEMGTKLPINLYLIDGVLGTCINPVLPNRCLSTLFERISDTVDNIFSLPRELDRFTYLTFHISGVIWQRQMSCKKISGDLLDDHVLKVSDFFRTPYL